MEYTELKEKFQREFYINYENFINQKVGEIKQAISPIDISQYTSITVTEPKVMIQDFLKKEKINDQMLGSFNTNFRLSLSLLLELDTYDQRRKLDIRLFNEIIKHNSELRNKQTS